MLGFDTNFLHMSHVMRKHVFAICEQQRCRSACASAQSDQCICCMLPGKYYTSSCYSRSFKTLGSLCSSAGQFESYLVENPEDRFSHDKAHIILLMLAYYSAFYSYIYKLTGSCVQTSTSIQTCTVPTLFSHKNPQHGL